MTFVVTIIRGVKGKEAYRHNLGVCKEKVSIIYLTFAIIKEDKSNRGIVLRCSFQEIKDGNTLKHFLIEINIDDS